MAIQRAFEFNPLVIVDEPLLQLSMMDSPTAYFDSAMDRLGAVAPVTVLALAVRNSLGLACISVIFHGANL